MNINETPFGYEIQGPHFLILFGNKESSLVNIHKAYTHLKLKRLKQTHSDSVVYTHAQSPDYEISADAHWTDEHNLALAVITADCVPVFFYDPHSNRIAGAHAGWRGVASNILRKTLFELTPQHAFRSDVRAFIGPHIQKNSFEIDLDVKQQILHSLGELSANQVAAYTEDLSPTKVLLDLHSVVLDQLLQEGLTEDHIHSLYVDTVSDQRFHSHRRDKDKAGRQISFIVKNA